MPVTDPLGLMQEFFVVVIGPVLIAALPLLFVLAVCAGLVMFIRSSLNNS
jgi:hypothetical protein